MNKVAPTMVAIAALTAAAAVGYSYMKPQAKNQLARDAKLTMRDMNDVREEMCDVRHDVTKMARNFKDNM